MKNKLLCFFLCLALTLCPAGTALADTVWPSGVSISADGGIVIDADSGAVLYGKNEDVPYYPASITKILTALLILENCDLDDTITFSSNAVNTLEPGASILGARAGDTLTVRDALYALLLQSANEVANALAEHCSGSIEAFAELMNKRAAELGCTDSHFANPSGLNDENHFTSARDMALIARAAFANPTFVEIDSAAYHDVPPGQLVQYPDGWRYYGHHKMLKQNDSAYYEGVIGGKTGYTSLAGNTLVTCAERNGLKLIAVVLNGHQTHYTDTKAMFDFGFANFKSLAVSDMDSAYQTVENDLNIGGVSAGNVTKLSLDKDSKITIPLDGNTSDVTSTISYDLDEDAPESALARIDYMYGEEKVGQAYLEAVAVAAVTPSPTPQTEETGENSQEADPTDASQADGESAGTGSDSANDSAPNTESAPANEPDSGSKNSILPLILKIVAAVAALAALAAAGFGIASYLQHKREEEETQRRERREKRLKEWGHSSDEFNLLMQERLRARKQFKKRSFFDRFRRR